MRFLFPVLLVLVLATTSCLKNNEEGCQAVAPETEAPRMISYCAAQGITYDRLSNGLFYQIIDSGAVASKPTVSSIVSVIYKGALLDGTVFDQQTTPVRFPLSNLIEGWKSGLPLIGKGGRIKLVIPSYMGYGCTGAPGIASNSILYFDITLSDVQ